MEDLVGVLALSAARDFVKRAYGMGAPPGSYGFAPGVGYGSAPRFGTPYAGMGHGYGGYGHSPWMTPTSNFNSDLVRQRLADRYAAENEGRSMELMNASDAELRGGGEKDPGLIDLYNKAMAAARNTSVRALNEGSSADPYTLVDPTTGKVTRARFGSNFLGAGEFWHTNDWNAWEAARDNYMQRYRDWQQRRKRVQGQADLMSGRAGQRYQQGEQAGQQGAQAHGQRLGAETGSALRQQQAVGQAASAGARMADTTAGAYGRALTPPGPPGPPAPPAPPGPGGRPAHDLTAGDDVIDRLARSAAGMAKRSFSLSPAAMEEIRSNTPAALTAAGALSGALLGNATRDVNKNNGLESAGRGALTGGLAGLGAGLGGAGGAHFGQGLTGAAVGALGGVTVGELLNYLTRRRPDRETEGPPAHAGPVYPSLPTDLVIAEHRKSAAPAGDDMPLPELDTHMKALHPKKKPARRARPLSQPESLARSAASRSAAVKEAGSGVGGLAAAAAGR